MNVPGDRRYSKDHEWALSEDDGTIRVGITDYAQDALGDVVFVELPRVGDVVTAGSTLGEVESTKSVSEFYSPVSGTVREVHSELADEPQRINEDPYNEGWICAIEPSDPSQWDDLLTPEAYSELIAT
jgi:glycine cleavage system H protein